MLYIPLHLGPGVCYYVYRHTHKQDLLNIYNAIIYQIVSMPLTTFIPFIYIYCIILSWSLITKVCFDSENATIDLMLLCYIYT